MAIFYGTSLADRILRESLTPGVTTDPSGLTGTLTDEGNTIYGYGGADLIEAGDGAGGDEYYDEYFVYGGTGGDTLKAGDSGYFALFGGDGNDSLLGWGGTSGSTYPNYALYGGAGADTITAGDHGYSDVYGGSGDDLINCTGWIEAGSGADTVYGGDSADAFSVVYAGSGNDLIYSAGYIDGGIGADTMKGAGDDTYVVDNVNDRIIETSTRSNDGVVVSLNTYRAQKGH